MNLGLSAVVPASWLPRLSSPPLGRVQPWKGSRRCGLLLCPQDGTISASSRPEADAHWRGPEREVPAPVSLLPSRALFSHFLLGSPDGPAAAPSPRDLGGGTGGGVHSEAKSAQVPWGGEEPIPRERPPPPANSRT